MSEPLYSVRVDQQTFLAINAYVRWLENYNIGKRYTPGYVVGAAMRFLWASIKGNSAKLTDLARKKLDG